MRKIIAKLQSVMKYITFLELCLRHSEFQELLVIKGGKKVCIFLTGNHLFGNLAEFPRDLCCEFKRPP